jgi:hypothetical protein
MTDKIDPTAAEQAKLEKLVKPTRTAKAEVPANVQVTELAHGSVLYNALPVKAS